ncbi:PLP-dependent aminotransferase family protein [Cryptosporangium aurantiacum]|uniref:DNA-binding transcriptional regulator, MocR family, contains an aminotransferase domain n=1 Tax=Cryptosporangium aurantiacum TaxID=134849 RepID=A0A1M7N1U4_9ACTN|nr:PLP-dependent aminotransferase family protein [Cryptosporangium aurantiacum]SHM97486.1 DNA-binding transcriptional regulator, MocR family, contains an aminotransferase domain [Cryptosporangium aurantiacum]
MTVEVDRYSGGDDRANDEARLLDVLNDWSVGDGPLYQQLADAIRRGIAEGALPAGSALPAERRLASVLAVSRATVVAAYDQLRGEGAVESRRGSGTRIARTARASRLPGGDGRVPGGNSAQLFQRLIDGPGTVLSLASAAGSADAVIPVALDEVARHDLAEAMLDPGYQPHGLARLRDTIAGYLTRIGLPSTPAEILVTTGAHQAVDLVAQLYLRPGSRVAVEAPGWPACYDVFRAAGATLVPVPIDQDGVRPEALAAILDETPVDLVYLMPTFHNPTGALLSAARRRRIVELAAEHDVVVVSDDTLAGVSLGHEVPPPLPAFAAAAGDRSVSLIQLGSLSKSVWGGLRVGWARASADVISRLARRKALADLGSPIIDQLVAARIVPELEALVRRRVPERQAQLATAESLLAEYLPSWRWQTPVGGPCLWVELPDVDAAVFAQVALRHGVEAIPGRSMDLSGNHDSFLRLPYCFGDEFLTEVVRRLATAWAELDRHGPWEPRLRPVV